MNKTKEAMNKTDPLDELEKGIGAQSAADFKRSAESAGLKKSPTSGTAGTSVKPARVHFLNEAARLTNGNRDQDYGEPTKNMAQIAEQWSLYIRQKYGVRVPLTGADAAMMQMDVKKVRTYASQKDDTYIDGACYFAIAGECEC